MKLKRFSKKQLKNYCRSHKEPPYKGSEPHIIPQCPNCGEMKHLEFRRDGDDQMYFICHHCYFESQPIGPAPYYLK